MDELIKALRAEFRAEAQKAVEEVFKPLEMMPDLPLVATTQEIAAALRVSDDIFRRMAEEGMPHTHAGRELRFVKALIVGWLATNKRYFCEICSEKYGRTASQDVPDAAVESSLPSTISHKTAVLSSKTQRRLAEFASTK